MSYVFQVVSGILASVDFQQSDKAWSLDGIEIIGFIHGFMMTVLGWFDMKKPAIKHLPNVGIFRVSTISEEAVLA